MSNPTATRSQGRVLLGVIGDGEDWSELRGHLIESSWQVDLFDATPRTDRRGPELMLPRLDGFDMAMLVVSGADTRADATTVRSLIHLTGVLQGKLGYRRVLVLVEGEVDTFLGGTGVPELPYERGNIRSRFPQISSSLSEISAPDAGSPMTPLFERVGIGDADGIVAPEFLVAFGLVVVLAIMAGVAGFQLLGSDDGDEVASNDSAASASADESGLESEPLGPQASVDAAAGMVSGLPARCELDLGEEEVIDQLIDCTGLGGLRAEGFLGPWHRDISFVSVEPGVVGQVVLSSDSGSSNDVVALEPIAEQSLEQFNSLFGVESIVLEFTDSGQEVILHQRDSRGGNELLLTFDVDL